MRVGTRGSALALAQARWVAERLDEPAEVVAITTAGDRGDGLLDKARWTSELERALLDGRIDVAVHSAKDVPAELAAGTEIGAVPSREDPADVICGVESLEALGLGARVGTSSLRRAAQLLALREDLQIVELRGNVDTRLSKLARGDADAIVLAAAGLQRLGWGDIISETFRPDIMCPAVGQGALAIETLEEGVGYEASALLDDPWTRLPVTAERAMLAELGGGCQVPIGAFGTLDNTELFLTGAVFSTDGGEMIRYTATGECTRPAELGRNVAQVLLKRGAKALLDRDAA